MKSEQFFVSENETNSLKIILGADYIKRFSLYDWKGGKKQ